MIKMAPDTKYEWHVFADKIEVNLLKPGRKTKPEGTYMHPKYFTAYRMIYGTVAEFHERVIEDEHG